MYISAIHGRRRLFLPLWRRWSAELAARNRRNGGVRHRFGAPRSFAQAAAAAAPCLTKERRTLRAPRGSHCQTARSTACKCDSESGPTVRLSSGAIGLRLTQYNRNF